MVPIALGTGKAQAVPEPPQWAGYLALGAWGAVARPSRGGVPLKRQPWEVSLPWLKGRVEEASLWSPSLERGSGLKTTLEQGTRQPVIWR